MTIPVEHPPRKWIFAGSVLNDFKRDEDFVEYISLAEHEAIVLDKAAWHEVEMNRESAKMRDLQSKLAVAEKAIEDALQVAVWIVDDCKLNDNKIKSTTVNRALDVHRSLKTALAKIRGEKCKT